MTNPEAFMTPAERLAARLRGESSPFASVATKQITLRLPEVLVAKIDAIAGHANLTRTDSAAMLLAAGYESTAELLTAEVQAELHDAAMLVLESSRSEA